MPAEVETRLDRVFLWIDAEKRALQYVSVNEAPHQKAALDLLGHFPAIGLRRQPLE